MILCAILTSQTIAQQLTSYQWLRCSRIGDDLQVLHVSHCLYALRLSIQELGSYYKNLPSLTVTPGFIPPRFCPFITSFVNAEGSQVAFKYVAPMERDLSCVTFRAIHEDTNTQVVVKFVSRYGKDAHCWMASQGLAPKLIHYGKLESGYGTWALVVMEFIEGRTLSTLYGDDPLPQDVLGGIRHALDVLNNGGFVFGDLQRPNVMLVEGTEPLGGRIRFIDFDWAGKEGPELRYPFHLSEVVHNASGAQDYARITKEHQERMLMNL